MDDEYNWDEDPNMVDFLNFSKRSEEGVGMSDDTEGMCTHCQGSGCSHCAGLGYHDVPMSDVDMPIQDKGYLNLDDPTVGDPYDSYMNDEEDYAKSYADKDIRSHYNKPGFDLERGYALDYDDVPYPDSVDDMMPDMGFFEDEDMAPGYRRGQEIPSDDEVLYDSYMEDGMYEEEEFATIEDELGLPPATADVDETDYEHTPMMGESIEDVDSLMEIIDIDENDEDMDIEMNNPAPAKEPATKPTPTKEPGKDRPAKPSRRPFTPPPHIRPGEEPRPKAGRDNDSDVEFE